MWELIRILVEYFQDINQGIDGDNCSSWIHYGDPETAGGQETV